MCCKDFFKVVMSGLSVSYVIKIISNKLHLPRAICVKFLECLCGCPDPPFTHEEKVIREGILHVIGLTDLVE